MPRRHGLELLAGSATGRVLPDEGGVLVDLRVDGVAVLASTPWSDGVVASAEPAPDEDSWVRRWHGGWQACLPTAGQPDPADPTQGFHGAASQAPWSVRSIDVDRVELSWSDAAGAVAQRTVRLHPHGAETSTVLRNDGASPREVIVAEHLVLGGGVLDDVWELVASPDVVVERLDIDGRATGARATWAVVPELARIDESVPARLTGLRDVTSPLRLRGPLGEIEVSFGGDAARHVLVWTELAATSAPPWDRRVRALGIEPGSAAHGAGTAARRDVLRLDPGASTSWRTRLDVRWAVRP